MSMIQTALAEFDETKAALATVKEFQSWTIAVNGYGQVNEARKRVKRLRIDVDKRRKELNEGALTYQRAVNEEAKRLTSEIVTIEDHLEREEKAWELEKAKEKAAKDAEKAAILQGRVNRLAEAGCLAGDVAAWQAMTDDEFEWHLRAEASKAAKIREEQEAARLEAERIESEKRAEAARIEAERQAEHQRQHEANRIERERLAAEREELQRQAAEQSRELRQRQEEIARQQAEQAKILFAQQAAIDRERAETAAKVAADRRAEDERLAAIERQQQEVARLARLEALKPEIEKAETFGNALLTDARDELARLGDPHWSAGAMESVRRCALEVLMIARGEA